MHEKTWDDAVVLPANGHQRSNVCWQHQQIIQIPKITSTTINTICSHYVKAMWMHQHRIYLRKHFQHQSDYNKVIFSSVRYGHSILFIYRHTFQSSSASSIHLALASYKTYCIIHTQLWGEQWSELQQLVHSWKSQEKILKTQEKLMHNNKI